MDQVLDRVFPIILGQGARVHKDIIPLEDLLGQAITRIIILDQTAELQRNMDPGKWAHLNQLLGRVSLVILKDIIRLEDLLGRAITRILLDHIVELRCNLHPGKATWAHLDQILGRITFGRGACTINQDRIPGACQV